MDRNQTFYKTGASHKLKAMATKKKAVQKKTARKKPASLQAVKKAMKASVATGIHDAGAAKDQEEQSSKPSRVTVPAGSRCFIFKMGQPLNEESIYQMVKSGVLPEKFNPYMQKAAEPLTPERVFLKAINELRHLNKAGQNDVIANILREMGSDRGREVDALLSDREMLQKKLDKAQSHLRAFENIRQGGLEDLKMVEG